MRRADLAFRWQANCSGPATSMGDEPIVVVTEGWRPDILEAFLERRARGWAHTGFFTREDIEESQYLADLAQRVPGVHINTMYMLGAGVLRVHTASLFLGPPPSAAVPATATTRHRSLSGHSQDRGTRAVGVGRAAHCTSTMGC